MIEWFLSPKDDNERTISYAMKLYQGGRLVDLLTDKVLNADDRNLDRKLKNLQVRDLASRQGLDPDEFMNDDANEGSRTAQGAVAYGMDKIKHEKGVFKPASFSIPAQQPRSAFKAAMHSAEVPSPGFFFKEAMRDLKAVAGSATMGGRAKAIARFASVL